LVHGEPAEVRRAPLSTARNPREEEDGEDLFDGAVGVELYQLPVVEASLTHPGFYSSLFELVLLWHASMGKECMAYVDVILSLPWPNAASGDAFHRMVRLCDEILPLGTMLSPTEHPPAWLPLALRAATAMLRSAGDFTRPGNMRAAPQGGAGGTAAGGDVSATAQLGESKLGRFEEYLRIAVLCLREAGPQEARELIGTLLGEIMVMMVSIGLGPGEALSPRGVDGSLAPTAMARGVRLSTPLLAVLDASPFLQRADLTGALCTAMLQNGATPLAVPMLVACGEAVGDPVASVEIAERCIERATQDMVMWVAITAPLDWTARFDFPQLCVNSGAVLSLVAWAWPALEGEEEEGGANPRGVGSLGLLLGGSPIDLMAHCLSLPPTMTSTTQRGPKHVLLWSLVLMRGSHECPDSLNWSVESLPRFVECLRQWINQGSPGYAIGALVGASTEPLPVECRLMAGFLVAFVARRCRDHELSLLDPETVLPSLWECGPDGSKLSTARSLAVSLANAVDRTSLCGVARCAMDVARLAYPDAAWLEAGLRELQANFEESDDA